MAQGNQNLTSSDSYKLRDEANKAAILNILNNNKRGMTVNDIAGKTQFSRETISKHLQALEYENEIYTQKFGNVLVAYSNHGDTRAVVMVSSATVPINVAMIKTPTISRRKEVMIV